MRYKKFLKYNIIGAILWVAIFLFGGYLFGNIPIVKSNFTAAIILIILISLIPIMLEIIRNRIKYLKEGKNKTTPTPI